MACLVLVLPARAADPPTSDPAHASDDRRVAELERKVEALTREIEALKLGAVAETTRAAPRIGLAPAAARVYAQERGVSIGGYGEMLLERFDRTRQDGALSEALDRLDFLRAVFYVGYRFSDELLFDSELEWEHAGVLDEAGVAVDTSSGRGVAELSGEVTLEFAYLDWSRHRGFGVRAGKLLVPVGLTNEIHEPPVTLAARRPDVETFIIPTTWGANGAGVYGELGGAWIYRAYVLEGLDGEGFRAESAIRGGRQNGAQSLVTHPAFAGRVDFAGVSGLVVGGSAYTGVAWQEAQPATGKLRPRVTLLDAHARFERRGLQARALYVRGTLDQAYELSSAIGLVGDQRLGSRFFGGYVEAAYDVLPRAWPGTPYALLPYARYEQWDTQEDVPTGIENPAHHHTSITAGVAFKPHPNVALKADRQRLRNGARTETSRWNVALGYLF